MRQPGGPSRPASRSWGSTRVLPGLRTPIDAGSTAPRRTSGAVHVASATFGDRLPIQANMPLRAEGS